MTSEEYLDSLLKSMEETEVNQSDNPLIKKIITDFEEEQTEVNIENVTEEFSQEALSAEEAFFAEAAAFEEMFMSEVKESDNGDTVAAETSFEELLQGDIISEEAATEEIPVDLSEDKFSNEMTDLEELLGKENTSDGESNFFGDVPSMDDNAVIAELMEGFREKEDIFGDDTESPVIEEEWKNSLDEILASTEMPPEEMSTILDDMDVTELIDNMEDADSDLAEINDLLKKSDNNEAVEADMMELLGSFQNDLADEEKNADEELLAESFSKEKKIQKEKKKFKFPGFKRKKNKKAELDENTEHEEVQPAQEVPEQSVLPHLEENGKEELSEEESAAIQNLGFTDAEMGEWEALFNDEVSEGLSESEEATEVGESEKTAKKKKAKKEKKRKKDGEPGFFGRILQMLTQETEAENKPLETDENEEILKELDKEDKAKAKKEKKSKKEKKEKGAKKKGADKPEKPAKKQKPPKEKKEKKSKEEREQKKGKSVNIFTTRLFLVLVAFGATVIAAVVALSFFLNDYADKKAAREAFYTGDYEEAYVLLSDKNLSDNDALILGRVSAILELERNKKVYDFYVNMEDEPKALNALLNGVHCYQKLLEENAFGADEELNQIYFEILNILNISYGIDESFALEMISYEKEEYSKVIYTIAGGMEFDVADEEQTKEETVPEISDVLPEEEAIIDMGTGNEGA